MNNEQLSGPDQSTEVAYRTRAYGHSYCQTFIRRLLRADYRSIYFGRIEDDMELTLDEPCSGTGNASTTRTAHNLDSLHVPTQHLMSMQYRVHCIPSLSAPPQGFVGSKT